MFKIVAYWVNNLKTKKIKKNNIKTPETKIEFFTAETVIKIFPNIKYSDSSNILPT